MRKTGNWLKANGEAVYGCGSIGLDSTPYGRATSKPHHIYLHLYQENVNPGDGIIIENLKSTPVNARLLTSGKAVGFEREGCHLKIQIPENIQLDPISTIIDLEFKEEIPEIVAD